jgi:enoyl-CoA hydratase/carnithine racemase
MRGGRRAHSGARRMSLRYTKADTIATITIDNPPVNVFTPELHRELFEIIGDFLADCDIRVGILTATGSRAFCAGDDIKTERPKRTVAETIERHLRPKRNEDPCEYPGWEAEVVRLCEDRFKPIVGAVNGPVLGQGLIYMLRLTDLRIAVPRATFGLPEIAYGMAGASGLVRLGRQIPPVAALWLALTGERFDAEQALRNHLINEIVEPERLMGRAFEIAARIAAHPPIAVRVEMEAFYRTLDMTSLQATAFTGHLYRLQRAAMDPTPPLARGKSGGTAQSMPQE